VSWATPSQAERRAKSPKPYFAFYFQTPKDNSSLSGGAIDFDRDGDLDLVTVSIAPGAFVEGESVDPVPIRLFRNDRVPNEEDDIFVEVSGRLVKGIKAVNVGQYGVGVYDFNGDGLDDLYLGDYGPDIVPYVTGGQSILALGTKSRKLRNVTRKNLPRYLETTHDAAFGDVDGDGDIDIFERNAACLDSGTPRGPQLLINDGHAHFTMKEGALPVEIRTGDCQSYASALVDVDLDGDLDLVDGMAKDLYDSPAVLFNDGSGTFEFNDSSLLPKRAPAFETIQIESADLDLDGWPDLVLTNFDIDPADAFLQILMNRGGVFVDATNKMMPSRKQIGNGLNNLALADFNGDGWIDMVLSNNAPDDKWGPRFLFNKRGKKLVYAKKILFDESGEDPIGKTHSAIPIAADFDQDGDIDVVFQLGPFWYLENLRPYRPFR
jgi:hypothetical protein